MAKTKSKKRTPGSADPALSLPPNAQDTVNGSALSSLEIVQIGVDDITIEDKRDRDLSDQAELDAVKQLAESMATRGLLQPIKVVGNAAHGYALVYGERRLAAAKMLRWQTVPCVVGSDVDLEVDRVIENTQREDPNAIQQAIAVADAVDAALEDSYEADGYKTSGWADEDPKSRTARRAAAVAKVAAKIGKSTQWVYDRTFLGELDSATRLLVVTGKLPMAHARELAAIADVDTRVELAKRYAGDPAKEQSPRRLSDLKHDVGGLIRRLDKVNWDLSVPFANAPACDVCPMNSRNIAGLFQDTIDIGTHWRKETLTVPEAGICTNQSCYGKKSGTVNRQIATAAQRLTKAELTVSAKGKDEKAKAIGKVPIDVPAHVKPDQFKREARARAKDKLAVGAGSASGTSRSPRARTPEDEARATYQNAYYRWESKAREALNKSLKSKPTLRVLLDIVLSSKYGTVEVGYENGKFSESEAKRLRGLLKDVEECNSWERFVKLASLPNDGRIYPDVDPGTMAELARLSNADIETAPVLADFLPKANPDKAEQRTPAKSGKKKTGKKGKSTAPAPTAGVDLDSDDELDGLN